MIPAGGIVMALLALAKVHEIDGAPIVNGLIALVKVAEMAVGIRRLTGTFTSKKLTYAPPTGDLLADIRRAYGARLSGGALKRYSPSLASYTLVLRQRRVARPWFGSTTRIGLKPEWPA